MAGPKIFDRVKDTSTTTGTGTLTLANSAPTGFRTFGSVLSNSDTCFYAIASSGGSEWEVGIGTYTSAGTTLARTTVLASSNAGAAVNLSAGTKDVFIPTPAQVQNYLYNPTNTVANLTPYMAGRVGFPSNGFSLLRDTGSAMVPWGPIYPLTDPQLQTFAWINQGSATETTTNGGLYLAAPSNGTAHNFRIRKKSAPSTPYTVTMGFVCLPVSQSSARVGACFRQSSDGKLVILELSATDAGFIAAVQKWDSPSTFNAGYVLPSASIIGNPAMIFVRLGDDGANRAISMSSDGVNFWEIHSIGRTDYLTADEVGFFINPYSQANGLLVISWKEA